MWTVKRLCICLLAALLWLAAGTSSQAETMYQISSSELIQLETNLGQLNRNNEIKQKLLTEQKSQLTEASKQLETIKEQLTKSKILNAQTQKSLESANRFLKQLETEAKRKVRVKTRQRNIWIGVSTALLYAYIKK